MEPSNSSIVELASTPEKRAMFVLLSALYDIREALKDKDYERAEFTANLALKGELTLNPFNPSNHKVLEMFRARVREEDEQKPE